MRKFAEGTKVSSDKSEAEIRSILKKFGANKYAYYEDDAVVGFSFEYENRRVRITLELPDPESSEFLRTPGRSVARSQEHQLRFWQQECNRQWRALTLTVKAKLISVAEGIRTFEQEFLYDMVLQNNQTVGEYLAPQMKAIETGKLPPLLPGIGETA